MSDHIGRHRLPDPDESIFDEEAGSSEFRLFGSRPGVSGLAAVLLSGGVLVMAWSSLWESNHPAAGPAREIQSAERADRLKAIHELEQMGDEDTEVAIPALIVGLSDSEAGLRAASARALVTVVNGAMRTESGAGEVREAVTALLGSMKDPDAAVRSAVAQALWMIVVTWQGPLGVIDLGTIGEALEGFATDTDAGVRHAAICGLGVIGSRISDAVPPGLLVALEDESPRNRLAAAGYLTHFPREVTRMIPSLVKSMEKAPPPLRAAYVEILAKVRPPSFAADAVPALIAVLHSPDAEVRGLAARSLGEFGYAAAKAVPGLLAILKGPAGIAVAPGPELNWDPVVSVVEALGRLAPGGPHAEESVAVLVKTLQSGDDRRRDAAAAALGGFGPAAASAIPGLIELLLRGPSPGRAAAAIALGRIAPTTSRVDQALDALSQSLRAEPDLPTTSVVIEAIGWFGPKAGPAIPRLEELVQSPNLKVSGAAQSALAILKVTQ